VLALLGESFQARPTDNSSESASTWPLSAPCLLVLEPRQENGYHVMGAVICAPIYDAVGRCYDNVRCYQGFSASSTNSVAAYIGLADGVPGWSLFEDAHAVVLTDNSWVQVFA
jgi:hypothetical protein